MRWCAPRDSSRRTAALDDRLRDVQHERQLQRRDALGIERPAVVFDDEIGASLPQAAQFRPRPGAETSPVR